MHLIWRFARVRLCVLALIVLFDLWGQLSGLYYIRSWHWLKGWFTQQWAFSHCLFTFMWFQTQCCYVIFQQNTKWEFWRRIFMYLFSIKQPNTFILTLQTVYSIHYILSHQKPYNSSIWGTDLNLCHYSLIQVFHLVNRHKRNNVSCYWHLTSG